MKLQLLWQFSFILQDAIYRSEYFLQIVTVILVLGSILGFMIGSAFGILFMVSLRLIGGKEEVAIKKATWIGGIAGAVLTPLISSYLIFSQV